MCRVCVCRLDQGSGGKTPGANDRPSGWTEKAEGEAAKANRADTVAAETLKDDPTPREVRARCGVSAQSSGARYPGEEPPLCILAAPEEAVVSASASRGRALVERHFGALRFG